MTRAFINCVQSRTDAIVSVPLSSTPACVRFRHITKISFIYFVRSVVSVLIQDLEIFYVGRLCHLICIYIHRTYVGHVDRRIGDIDVVRRDPEIFVVFIYNHKNFPVFISLARACKPIAP